MFEFEFELPFEFMFALLFLLLLRFEFELAFVLLCMFESMSLGRFMLPDALMFALLLELPVLLLVHLEPMGPECRIELAEVLLNEKDVPTN